MQLKIVSLNLAGYKDWQSREQKVVDFFNEANPDMLLLQEVHFDAKVSALNQAVSLNALLARPFTHSQTTISNFYQTSSGRIYREGLSVLSAFPIENSEVVVLNKNHDDKHPRIVQNIDIEVGGKSIHLSNIHLSDNKYSVEQFEEFLGILKAREERRIIAGDFNIFRLQDYAQLYGSEYVASIDFKDYVSFPSEGNTLDYILTPKAAQFTSLKAVDGLSDHSALLFEIDITKL